MNDDTLARLVELLDLWSDPGRWSDLAWWEEKSRDAERWVGDHEVRVKTGRSTAEDVLRAKERAAHCARMLELGWGEVAEIDRLVAEHAPAAAAEIRSAKSFGAVWEKHAAELAAGMDKARGLVIAMRAVAPQAPAPAPTEADEMLRGWEEILDAIRRPDEDRKAVKKLNIGSDGPIVVRNGAKPIVAKGKLLAWWNTLDDRVRTSQDREADRVATVEGQHAHGKRGAVVPEIRGAVKRRRSDRKP